MLLPAVAMLMAASAALPGQPINPGFEEAPPGGAPAGWTFADKSPGGEHRFGQAEEGVSGRAGRLYTLATPGTPVTATATITQQVDASPYRGGLVRLKARMRVVKAGGYAGIGLAVVRPQPKSAGFRAEAPLPDSTSTGWREVEMVGRVAPDAATLTISLIVDGDADVYLDDVTLAKAEPDPRPPSAEAAAYLEVAIASLRDHHIDSAAADWDRIIADARADIGGARTSRDVYPAIRGMLGALGEKHSFLIKPRPAGARPAASAAAAPVQPLPAMRLLDGRYALIALPTLDTFGPGGEARGELYRRTARSALLALDAQPLCGWIVDLRGNGGGNMWPMLDGIDPLLGPAPFGTFVAPRGGPETWQRIGGAVLPAAQAPVPADPAFRLRHEAAPVAVLIGPGTASSGEMVAVALAGRADVRSFGAPSAGFTTGNMVYPLPDGAGLAVTEVFIRDRQGRDYRAEIVPDQAAALASAEEAAMAWLAGQCRAAAPSAQASSSMSQ
jgi:hypothetical protein